MHSTHFKVSLTAYSTSPGTPPRMTEPREDGPPGRAERVYSDRRHDFVRALWDAADEKALLARTATERQQLIKALVAVALHPVRLRKTPSSFFWEDGSNMLPVRRSRCGPQSKPADFTESGPPPVTCWPRRPPARPRLPRHAAPSQRRRC